MAWAAFCAVLLTTGGVTGPSARHRICPKAAGSRQPLSSGRCKLSEHVVTQGDGDLFPTHRNAGPIVCLDPRSPFSFRIVEPASDGTMWPVEGHADKTAKFTRVITLLGRKEGIRRWVVATETDRQPIQRHPNIHLPGPAPNCPSGWRTGRGRLEGLQPHGDSGRGVIGAPSLRTFGPAPLAGRSLPDQQASPDLPWRQHPGRARATSGTTRPSGTSSFQVRSAARPRLRHTL